MIGVGGVVIRDGRALLIRRGSEPLCGEWSIPGGMLEVGETLIEGVARELWEETGLQVRVLELLEVLERIVRPSEAGPERPPSPPATLHAALADAAPAPDDSPTARRPLYHFVILDYLCEAPEGQPRAGGDVTEVAFAAEDELEGYRLSAAAARVIQKAFSLARTKGRLPGG
jgi:8-oxo-dGTP diphosphatase